MAQLVNYDILKQAGAATVDQPVKTLGMELLKEAGKYAKKAKLKADKVRADYPEGINVPKVDSDIRPGLITYLEQSKKEYDNAAKKLSLLPSWSPGYKKARDTINRIKDGYANIERDLSTLQANRTAASKVEPGHGATSYELAKSSDLVNGDYVTYDIQFSDQGVTYMDGDERKSISDFVAAPAADGVGAQGQATLYNKVVNDARSRIKWDETDQRANIDGFIDGMNNTQLKNWMFNGPRSYGYAIALNNLGYEEYPVIEETDDANVKKQKQDKIDKIDIEIDRLKYSDNLKGEQVRDQLYDALEQAYKNNLPRVKSSGGDGGGDFPLDDDDDVADNEFNSEVTPEGMPGFFGDYANEDKADDWIRKNYPDLRKQTSIPLNPGISSIRVGTETFYLKGRGNSTAEMELERLKAHLEKMQENYDNTPKDKKVRIQRTRIF